MTGLRALALLALVACHGRPPVPAGDVAATLTAKSIGEHAFDPASLRGKPCLVLFVSPTCPHCLKEMPAAAAAARDTGANLVAIFIAGKPVNAQDVARHFAGVSLWDDGTLRDRYNIRAVPYTLVLGADGHAIEAFEGAQDESTLRDAIPR